LLREKEKGKQEKGNHSTRQKKTSDQRERGAITPSARNGQDQHVPVLEEAWRKGKNVSLKEGDQPTV